MTEEFKSLLLKYLTGNITLEDGNNTPQFGATEVIVDELNTYINDHYVGATSPSIVDFQKSNTNNNYLFFGTGSDENKVFGFVIILDENLNIIYSTNKYSSDVIIGRILNVKQNSDGTYYLIEERYSDSKRRIVTLNNISQINPMTNTYSVVIRKSYIFSDSINGTMTIIGSIKDENSGKYFVFGSKINGVNSNPYAFELIVNVGQDNEWKVYDYVQTPTTILTVYNGWASWSSDGNINFKIIGGDLDNTGKIYVYSKSGDNIGTPTTYNIQKSGQILMSAVVLNESTSYILVSNVTNTSISDYFQTYYLYILKNDVLKQIYASDTKSRLQVDHNFFRNITTDYINTYISFNLRESSGNYKFYAGLVIEENVYVVELTDISSSMINVDFYSQIGFNTYNLYEFIFQTGDRAFRLKFTFDKNGYNGIAYENINSLVPKMGKLYNASNNLIFARTLYNKSVSNNTTISTIEIPNTFLNDIQITKEELLGETNKILNNKSQTITKNIYETVNLNFINSISMSNNNTQETILNQNGASRLNRSSSNDLDYDNAKATKIRINYVDGSSFIQKLGKNQIELIDVKTAMYEFVIFVKNDIENIQIISEDEQTVYQEITNLTLEKNKYYSITQMVEVEGE